MRFCLRTGTRGGVISFWAMVLVSFVLAFFIGDFSEDALGSVISFIAIGTVVAAVVGAIVGLVLGLGTLAASVDHRSRWIAPALLAPATIALYRSSVLEREFSVIFYVVSMAATVAFVAYRSGLYFERGIWAITMTDELRQDIIEIAADGCELPLEWFDWAEDRLAHRNIGNEMASMVSSSHMAFLSSSESNAASSMTLVEQPASVRVVNQSAIALVHDLSAAEEHPQPLTEGSEVTVMVCAFRHGVPTIARFDATLRLVDADPALMGMESLVSESQHEHSLVTVADVHRTAKWTGTVRDVHASSAAEVQGQWRRAIENAASPSPDAASAKALAQ